MAEPERQKMGDPSSRVAVPGFVVAVVSAVATVFGAAVAIDTWRNPTPSVVLIVPPTHTTDTATRKPPPAPPQDDTRSKKPDLATLYLDPELRPVEAGAWPWAVVMYGAARADDVGATALSLLRDRGRDTVTLFRNVAAERRLGPDLFRGSPSLGAKLRLNKYCSRLLVGSLSTNVLGSTEGLVMARATVVFRLLTPDGRIVSEVEVSEKGDGLTDEQASANAVTELRSTLPEKLSDLLE